MYLHIGIPPFFILGEVAAIENQKRYSAIIEPYTAPLECRPYHIKLFKDNLIVIIHMRK